MARIVNELSELQPLLKAIEAEKQAQSIWSRLFGFRSSSESLFEKMERQREEALYYPSNREDARALQARLRNAFDASSTA